MAMQAAFAALSKVLPQIAEAATSTSGGKSNPIVNILGLIQGPKKSASKVTQISQTQDKKSSVSFLFQADKALAAADLLAAPDKSQEILADLLSKRATEEAGSFLSF